MTRVISSDALAMRRTWNLNIEFRPFKPGTALYLQIAEQIIEKIRLGRLPPRTVMPGSRELAAMLNVNRKTIVLSYDELIAQGWLTTQHRRGTFVSAALPYPAKTQLLQVPGMEVPTVYAGDLSSAGAVADPALIITEGKSDKRIIPYEKFAKEWRRALLKASRGANMESGAKGYLPLRQAISSLLHSEGGLNIVAENLCITRSLQQSLYITARALIAPGDYVIFERLSAPSARQAFKAMGARILYADLDEGGVDEYSVEALCKHYPVKAVLLTPQAQYPTTVSLPESRRRKLLKLAEQFNFHIIAVDHTQQLYFNRSPSLPVASGALSKRIIHLGTLPHVLSPDVQIAYIANTPGFIEKCAHEFRLMEEPEDLVNQIAVTELIQSGEFHRMVRRISKRYNARRLQMAMLLHEELGDLVSWRMPEAGLSFWLVPDKKIEMGRFVQHAKEAHIALPAEAQYSDDASRLHGMRLGYSHVNEHEMKLLISRLKVALEAAGM